MLIVHGLKGWPLIRVPVLRHWITCPDAPNERRAERKAAPNEKASMPNVFVLNRNQVGRDGRCVSGVMPAARSDGA